MEEVIKNGFRCKYCDDKKNKINKYKENMILLVVCVIAVLFFIISGISKTTENTYTSLNGEENIINNNSKDELINEYYELIRTQGIEYSSLNEFKETSKAMGLDLDALSIDEIKAEINKVKNDIQKVKEVKEEFDSIVREAEKKYKDEIYNTYLGKSVPYLEQNVNSDYSVTHNVYQYDIQNIKLDSCYCSLSREKNNIKTIVFYVTLSGTAYYTNSQYGSSESSNEDGNIALEIIYDIENNEQYKNMIYDFNNKIIGQTTEFGNNYGATIQSIMQEKIFAINNYEKGDEFKYFVNY